MLEGNKKVTIHLCCFSKIGVRFFFLILFFLQNAISFNALATDCSVDCNIKNQLGIHKASNKFSLLSNYLVSEQLEENEIDNEEDGEKLHYSNNAICFLHSVYHSIQFAHNNKYANNFGRLQYKEFKQQIPAYLMHAVFRI